jgi:hypothetical protein
VTAALQARSPGHQAEELVARAGSDRAQLEEVRSRYLDLLPRASDDFDATEGLRIVERALGLMPQRHPDSAWQDRVRTSSQRFPPHKGGNDGTGEHARSRLSRKREHS